MSDHRSQREKLFDLAIKTAALQKRLDDQAAGDTKALTLKDVHHPIPPRRQG